MSRHVTILMPIRSEYGLHSGYFATMDMVKYMPLSKPPPDEREWAADRFIQRTPPNTSPIIRTRI